MENLEALVVHVLGSESLNVFLNEFEIGLIGLDWVGEIILNNVLLLVSEEWTNGLNAWGTLKVLRSQELVKMASKRNTASFGINFEEFKDSHEYLFETFEVPVLVNDGMDDSWEEDLLSLVC